MDGFFSRMIDQNGFPSATTSHNGSSVKPTNRRHVILNAMRMLISAAEGEWDNVLHTHHDLRNDFHFKELCSHSGSLLVLEMTSHGLALIKTFSSETINGLNELVSILLIASYVSFTLERGSDPKRSCSATGLFPATTVGVGLNSGLNRIWWLI